MAEIKRRFRLESGLDTSITLEIDTSKITEDLAAQINGFWSGDEDVLNASDGDVIQAVARQAAGPLLWLLTEGFNNRAAVKSLSKSEGWPEDETLGISIVDYEIPDFSADAFEVREIFPEQGEVAA